MKNIEKIAASILAQVITKPSSIELFLKQIRAIDPYAKNEKIIVNEPFEIKVQKTTKSLANGLPMMKTFKDVGNYIVEPAIYDVVSTTESYKTVLYWQENEFTWIKAIGNEADKLINQ
jgi:hypothetical protein